MSEHVAGSASEGGAHTGAIQKTTCKACDRTVYVVTVGNQRVATDSELIAVVPDGGRRGRSVVTARRLHAESCDPKAAKERARRELERYAAKQGERDLANLQTLDRLTAQLRTEYVATQTSMRRVRTLIETKLRPRKPPAGWRGKRTRGM